MLGHGVVRIVEQVRRVEKRLGRDAPHVEAGPSEGAAPLDAGHLEAELGALDGGDVAARPAADDDDILLLVSDGGRGERAERAEGAQRGGGGERAAAVGREREESLLHDDDARKCDRKTQQRLCAVGTTWSPFLRGDLRVAYRARCGRWVDRVCVRARWFGAVACAVQGAPTSAPLTKTKRRDIFLTSNTEICNALYQTRDGYDGRDVDGGARASGDVMMSISVPLKLAAHPCGVRPRAIRARAVSITAALRSHHSCAFHVGSHADEKNVRERLRTGVKTAALPQIAFPASIADALSVSRNSQTELALGATLVAFALWVLPAIMKSSWENLRANGGAESLMEGASSLVLPTRAFSPKDAQLGAKLRRKAREMATWETSIAQVRTRTVNLTLTEC